MTQFAGLCVGGPLAGKSISHPHQKMKLEQFDRRPLKEALEASLQPPGEPMEPIIYNWHHTGAQGFWIPEGQSLHDAINELALAYVEKHRGA